MTPSPTEQPLLTLAGIASLTHVQRAVVSAWRRRPSVNGRHLPFPEPVEVRSAQERFALDAVVEWLEQTQRGNNPAVRADALAHAQPAVRLDDAVVDAGLDALLCLKARTGMDLADPSPDAILDEADEVDPDDDHLVGEILALGDQLTSVAAYAQALTDAAWDAASAHELLRRRRAREASDSPPLSSEALGLLGRVGAAIAIDLESEIVIVDPLLSSPELVDAVLTELGEGVVAHALVVGDSTRARSARRLHWVRGRSVLSTAPPEVLPLVITRLPTWEPSAEPSTVLAVADDVQLDLTDAQRALVLGPASVLCDQVNDAALEQQRDHFIRLGRLRCALRLPPGLVGDGSRQALGLWVLGAEPGQRRVADHRLAAADLTNEPLRSDVVDDVVTDVVASLTDHAREAHAFRYAHLSATLRLLAESGPIVPAGSRPPRLGEEQPADIIMRVRRQADDLDAQVVRRHVLEGVTLTPAAGTGDSSKMTVDAAVVSKDLRVLPGTRITGEVPATTGGVRVICTDDLRDPMAPRRGLDALELEETYPRARRTEPGDVVFCVSPRPAAIVDDEGLSVVASPARVLRCAPDSGLVPEAIARAINDLPVRSPRWRAWRIPAVPPDQAATLRGALRHLSAEEDLARQRLADLGTLATEMAKGVATGAMTLDRTSTERTINDHSTTEEGH